MKNQTTTNTMNRMLSFLERCWGVLQISPRRPELDAVLEDHRRVVPGEIVIKFIDDADCDVVYDNMGKAPSAFDVQAFLPEGVRWPRARCCSTKEHRPKPRPQGRAGGEVHQDSSRDVHEGHLPEERVPGEVGIARGRGGARPHT